MADTTMSQGTTPVPSTEGGAQSVSEAELDAMQSILDFIYDYRTPEYVHSVRFTSATPN